MYLITRFNIAFKTTEYMTSDGVNFTLHLDKAARMSFEVAEAYLNFHGPKASITS